MAWEANYTGAEVCYLLSILFKFSKFPDENYSTNGINDSFQAVQHPL